MRHIRKLMAAMLALTLGLALAGCRGGEETYTLEETEAAALVRGNLDMLFLGKWDAEFLESVGADETTAKAGYDNNMEVEANYLLYYYRTATYGHSSGNSYSYVTDEQKEAAIQLCRDIYAKAKYTVEGGAEQADGSFAVTVRYSPLNIHELVNLDWSKFETDFIGQYRERDTSVMDDATFDKWLEEEVFPAYNQGVLDLVRSKVDAMSYGAEKSATIKVSKGEDGYYSMDYTSYDAFARELAPVSTAPAPTPTPTPEPSAEPSGEPTATPEPSGEPSTEPTAEPSAQPTAEPTATPAPTAAPETLHHVELTVKDYGVIKLELDETAAPKTVANFLKLAGEGFYDGLTFHRIMEGFMIQGGSGGSVDTVVGEFSANGWDNPISHVRGVISMARADDPDSASSQFFIVHQDSTFLDGKYAAFGRVTEGMEVVDAIAADAKPTDDNGTIPAAAQPIITSIVVVD